MQTALRLGLALSVIYFLGARPAKAAGPVTVGSNGNEPIVAVAPDGTLYISALQHIYRSKDSGASWVELPGSIFSSTLNLNSDSSIAIDPGGRLYFTFDYPFAGATAVCISDDQGTTFSCNPAVVPGGTDRMWITAPTNEAAYEVTNEGAEQTALLTSTDRGATFVPREVASGLLEPQTGPLLQRKCSSKVLQPTKIFGTSPSDVPEVKVYVYDPFATGSVIADVRSTGLALPNALVSGSLSGDGVLYIASEEPNPAGGKQAVVARSPDEGITWKKLPPIPGTETGTATFTWVAAGAPGHIGVIYYYSPVSGDPTLLASASWDTLFAESFDADTDNPTWTVRTLDSLVHTGAICAAAGCMGTDRFAGDFITAAIDPIGAVHLTWMKQENGTGAITIRYQQIQSGPPSTFVPAPCDQQPTPTPTPMATATPTASPTVTPGTSPTATPASPTPSPAPTPINLQLLNISGRVFVQSGDKVGIGGFIIKGSGVKRIIVRGIGPSLKVDGKPVSGAMQDPVLDLRDSRGATLTNDNWRSNQESEIEETGLAPSDDRESAIVIRLPAGNYTAVLRSADNSNGVGLVEIYDLDSSKPAELGNLSVRADVDTDDNVLIDGVILRGGASKRVLFRAMGPELQASGVAGELQDPTLELHDGNGALLATNNDWRDAPNAAEIESTGLAPKDDRESAILMTLSPGNYTSVVRGLGRTTGVALAETFKLD